jgi:hypothetical protein
LAEKCCLVCLRGAYDIEFVVEPVIKGGAGTQPLWYGLGCCFMWMLVCHWFVGDAAMWCWQNPGLL